MTDRLPTPEEMQIAAKELTDAQSDLASCKANAYDARREEERASTRVAKAAERLRGMTDQLAPPPVRQRVG